MGCVALSCAPQPNEDQLGRSAQAIVEAEFGAVGGSAAHALLLPPRVTGARPTLGAKPLAVDGPLPAVARPTDRTLAFAAGLPPNARLTIVAALAEPDFDFTRFRDANSDTAASLVALRRADLAPTQDAYVELLERYGATNISRRWIANQVVASVAVKDVPLLRAHLTLRELYYDATVGSDKVWYDGYQARYGVKTDTFIANGYYGSAGSRVWPRRMGIGISEVNSYPATAHKALLWGGTLGSRFYASKDCTSGSCVDTTVTSSGLNHGIQVTAIAASSIEQGQDSAVPVADRVKRSGQSPYSNIFHFVTGTADACSRDAAVVENAMNIGVDILNQSHSTSEDCSTVNYDPCGLNDVLRRAADAGLLVVNSAGNERDTSPPPACSVDYPGYRSEVLSVGWVNAGSSANGCASPTTDSCYTVSRVNPESSQGPVPIVSTGGASATTQGVALVAPGTFWHHAWQTPNIYDDRTTVAADSAKGSSVAAPVVTAAAGLLREAFNNIGWAGNDTRVLLTNMLLMGDGYDGDTNGYRTGFTSGASVWTGFGRTRMHFPQAASFPSGPWGWGYRSFVMYPGTADQCWPVWASGYRLAPPIRQWKWAVAWFPTNFAAVPDVDIYVKDTCHGDDVRSFQNDYDFRNRIDLRDADLIGPDGQARCLMMCASAYSVPAAGVRIYSADRFQSEVPD